MISKLFSKTYNATHHAKSNNLLYLLISILCILVMPIITTIFPFYTDLVTAILFNGMVLMGLYICTSSLKEFLTGFVLGFVAWLTLWLGYANKGQLVYALFSYVSLLVYFLYLSYHLFRSLRKSKMLNNNMIFAAISGFLMLGLIGGQLIHILESVNPHSFSNLMDSYYNTIYFSFVSLTTTGYGDIIPKTDAAKSLSLLIGVAGQMYVTIIVGIIVGKFLKNQ